MQRWLGDTHRRYGSRPREGRCSSGEFQCAEGISTFVPPITSTFLTLPRPPRRRHRMKKNAKKLEAMQKKGSQRGAADKVWLACCPSSISVFLSPPLSFPFLQVGATQTGQEEDCEVLRLLSAIDMLWQNQHVFVYSWRALFWCAFCLREFLFGTTRSTSAAGTLVRIRCDVCSI